MSVAIVSVPTVAQATNPNDMYLFGEFADGGAWTPVGSADPGTCLQGVSDGKYLDGITGAPASFIATASFRFYDDGVTLPPGASITSVKVAITFQCAHQDFSGAGYGLFHQLDATTTVALVGVGSGADTSLGMATYKTAALAVEPVTGAAWTRAKCFGTDYFTGTGFWGLQNASAANPSSVRIDAIQLEITYTAAAAWYYNPITNQYQYTSDPGSPWVLQSVAPTPVITQGQVQSAVTNGVDLLLLSGTTANSKSGVAPTLVGPGFGCSAGGTSVAIIGTGFGTGATVTFGGGAATNVVVYNSTTIVCTTPAHADGAVDIVVTNPDNTTATATGGFTYGTPWWVRYFVIILDGFPYVFESWVQQCTAPSVGIWNLGTLSAPTLTWWYNATYGWSVYQVASPNSASGAGWAAASAPATTDGWYVSPWAMGGSISVIDGQRPKDPRTWAEIATWATADTGMLGGSPAASCIYENHMIYPAKTYTPGTDYPPIRVFDGSFDHELCRLPPTTTNTIPKAVMSMLTANGTIYLSSWDSGTTSADWAGRVFQLDLNSGALTPLGGGFSGGEMPYALAWHEDRLWCGTNNGIGTVGKVYFFRPGIDTAWTMDHSLATDTLGGVDSLCSYQGRLFVGSDNAAGTFAKIMVRSALGVYTTSDTGSGGAAHVNNGFLAMSVFQGNLYASFWNNDTPAIAKIRKYDNSSWSTVYSGASATLRPYILLFSDNNQLFAVGGGKLLAGAIVRSNNGTTWTDLTPTLPESNKTLLPIYGVEVL